MLVELLVEDFAVVERLRVRFHAGLNLLTGETGSGKSIVVGALGLLFGGRASADTVRSGAKRARISAIFELPNDPALDGILAAAGIEVEDGELLIEREILAGGKSRAFAGSRPATAGLLREIAPFLGDIHGQHDQQRLFSSEVQLTMLDSFAGNQEHLDRVSAAYGDWRTVCGELSDLESNEQERLRLADLWRFQRREIEQVSPEAREDVTLGHERRVLQNVARLEESINTAYTALYDSESSALARLRHSWSSLEEACRFDDDLRPLKETLQTVEITVEEAAHELRHYLGRLEADPDRLDEIESRLASLDNLKRKYGASIEEVLEFLAQVRADLEAMESSEERREELTRRKASLARVYEDAAGGLRKHREAAARKLEKRLEKELRTLAMERTTFRIEMDESAWSAAGSDRVRYLISPNPGEEPRPMDKIASGGELSRIALALKTCVLAPKSRPGGASGVRTMVFDEVDAGVGGGAAETVGRRLKQLSAVDQVLCVTHLPQIAGFADHHYHVEKREENGRTVADIKELTSEHRVREIGRMLSGQRLTREALRHAEQLIKMAAS